MFVNLLSLRECGRARARLQSVARTLEMRACIIRAFSALAQPLKYGTAMTVGSVDCRSMCTCLLKERFHLLISFFRRRFRFFVLLIWGSSVWRVYLFVHYKHISLMLDDCARRIDSVEHIRSGRDGHSLKCNCVCRQLRTWLINLFIFGILFFNLRSLVCTLKLSHSCLTLAHMDSIPVEFLIRCTACGYSSISDFIGFCNRMTCKLVHFQSFVGSNQIVIKLHHKMNGKTCTNETNKNKWQDTCSTQFCGRSTDWILPQKS